MKSLSLALLILLCGCLGGVQERSGGTSVAAAEKLASQNNALLNRTIDGQKTPPAPNVTVTGSSNSIAVAVNPQPTNTYRETITLNTASNQSASQELESASFFKKKLPMSVALVLFGVGFLILFVVIWLWRRSSVAVNEAYKLADETFASIIRERRNRAMVSTDAAEMSRLNADVAELESHRGRLAR